jgi:hypothetical protein
VTSPGIAAPWTTWWQGDLLCYFSRGDAEKNAMKDWGNSQHFVSTAPSFGFPLTPSNFQDATVVSAPLPVKAFRQINHPPAYPQNT